MFRWFKTFAATSGSFSLVAVLVLAGARTGEASVSAGKDVSLADVPIPSFSRQTGLACSVCHTSFPQLTPFGRQFKLDGYTMTGAGQKVEAKKKNGSSALDLGVIPPVSFMAISAYTVTRTGTPDTQNGDLQFPQEFSLFVGGEIAPKLGSFVQLTYEPGGEGLGLDNTDVRFSTKASEDVTLGLTLNNNPTVSDLWNSTPAWGFPFTSSEVAPGPAAGTLVDGALGGEAAGLGGYGMFAKTVYTEFALYRSAQQGGPQPPDATAEGVISGVAPYWRAAVTHDWGPNSIEVGTYGLYAKLFPEGVAGLTNDFTDVAFDAQYQHISSMGALTAHGTWIHEKQNLDATFQTGGSANASNNLNTVRGDLSYHFSDAGVGLTLGAFSTTGTTDTGLYGPEEIDGSLTGNPKSNGFVGQIGYMPWLNTRFALQYVLYSRFNGGSTNYDGFGRSASDNNTLYLLSWIMF
jgi:hypothetical protein